MQQTTVVRSSKIAYIILEAMLLLQLLGQHEQIAQVADPRQHAAVPAREIIPPILNQSFLLVSKN